MQQDQAQKAFWQMCHELNLELQALGSLNELDALIEAIVGYADTETQDRWIEIVEAKGTSLETSYGRDHQLKLLMASFQSGVMTYRIDEGLAIYDELTAHRRT